MLKADVNPLLDPVLNAYIQGWGALCTRNPNLMCAFFLSILIQLIILLMSHLLIQKHKQININPIILNGVFQFLMNLTHFVKVNNTLSYLKLISTVAPQCCVTLYTNECVGRYLHNYICKFSDDTAILSVLLFELLASPSIATKGLKFSKYSRLWGCCTVWVWSCARSVREAHRVSIWIFHELSLPDSQDCTRT